MHTTPSRLFDLAEAQNRRFPQTVMLGSTCAGKQTGYASGEVILISRELAAGLLKSGISGRRLTPESQDKVAVLSWNCPEWVLLDLACQQIGAILVPVYPNISEAELELVLRDAGVKMAFAGNADLYEKIKNLQPRLPALEQLFTLSAVPGAAAWDTLLSGITEADHRRVGEIRDSIRPDHLATIIYTSGTTGEPKGVMLTHGNIVSNVLTCIHYLPCGPGSRALSFLPLNHVFERMITYLYIYGGVSVYYAAGTENLAEDLRTVRPHIFTTVPRLLEKVYEKILAKGETLKGLKRILFFRALAIGKRYALQPPPGLSYRIQLYLARRLVFSKWKAALGGTVEVIVSGSAACQLRLLKLFTAAGITVLEGYGLTETAPVISVNRAEPEARRFGTVGPVIDGVEVRIAEDGEICCKGPGVTPGYYRRPDLTAEAIRDGWLYTGDVGSFTEGRFLQLTDRKKALFKTSGGKYVAPQPVENKMMESPFIEQIMVVGADRKFTAALVVPAFTLLEAWYRQQRDGVPDEDGGDLPNGHDGAAYSSKPATGDHTGAAPSAVAATATPGDMAAALEDLVQQPEVLRLYEEIIARYNPQFGPVEQIKKFTLLPRPWSVESGELTPTLKPKRKIIQEKFAAEIEEMYHSANVARTAFPGR
ncbi:long-chain fatty acid--CoA ligase [Compostibacter hankyongensis]|uniref:Long-chain fatty acid--CoA ligase n=1 Tax=Compostibacter hankyongensis TaxID=1007089 RepID=A0ABP8FGK3_9BACT